ncbi:uncharacterized protein SCHCODRAFT_02632639 [Schizophyllum commune H4-8]|uniref:uncharacterized protein n=1 Tax=Schizophyllum commune (strain H4-8 / FGSC 9210) TaxID=578458 RepID=UPI00215F2177|nr:uncharacterized protein SCHCODRAFT_02632639 [Schizophyllum commune H4-8]KAI5890699.1 hypothetical protein SCHCODRAFT_02632639 [Schizophyllum commune H4-8]
MALRRRLGDGTVGMTLRSVFTTRDELALLKSMYRVDDCMNVHDRMSEKPITEHGEKGNQGPQKSGGRELSVLTCFQRLSNTSVRAGGAKLKKIADRPSENQS